MLRALGQVCTTPDQNEEARRNGHVLILREQESTAMETAENVLALRHFLTRSDRPAEATNGRDAHLLLVIGRLEFYLCRTDVYGGCVEQLLGDEEQGDYAAAVVAADAGDGAAMLGPCTFFEPIAKALERTGRILVVGEWCGSRLEMDHFFGWLTRQHPDLAGRIAGSLVLSEAATAKTGRLLERARDYFTHVRGV